MMREARGSWLGCRWWLWALLLPGMVWAADCDLNIGGLDAAASKKLLASLQVYLPDKDKPVEMGQDAQVADVARQGLEVLGFEHPHIQVHLADRSCRIEGDAGPPTLIRSSVVQWLGDAQHDEAMQALLRAVPWKLGDRLDQTVYEGFKSQVEALAHQHGYFQGHWVRHAIQLDAEHQQASVTLIYDAGQRYRLGAVTFIKSPVAEHLLRTLVPFSPGTPYDANLLMRLNQNLLSSHYFTHVEVQAEHEQAVDGQIPVRVLLTAGQRNTVAAGVGYATDIGPRIILNWSRPLLTEAGHSIDVQTQFSPIQSSIQATYSIPLSQIQDDTLQWLYGFQRYKIINTITDSTILGPQYVVKTATQWRDTFFLHWTRDDFSQTDGTTGRSNLLLPGMTWARSRSRGGVDPSWGDQQVYLLQAANAALGSDANVVDMHASFRLLRTFEEVHQLLFRLDTGAIAASNWANIPPTLRFFAGGDQSIRGYGFNALGPTDSHGNVLGGHYLLVGSIQYGFQWRPRWRPHVFVDAGNAYDSLHGATYKSTGFGVSWHSPVGPLSIDLAFGLAHPNHPVRMHFYMGPPL